MNRLEKYMLYLEKEEKSEATKKQYACAIRQFLAYACGKKPERETVIAFKKHLMETYRFTSVNAKLSAVNGFLSFCGMDELRVRQIRIQRKAFIPRERILTQKEYRQLLKQAKASGNERLSLMMQTICATGIRVSELQYITVEAAEKQQAVISLKGKTRVIMIPERLCGILLKYAHRKGVSEGFIFRSKNGHSIGRTAIWRMMKSLCAEAGVAASKVFPHSLRHLFARAFYAAEKDIARLADILGHSNINTTRIYIASSGQEHRKIINSLRLLL